MGFVIQILLSILLGVFSSIALGFYSKQIEIRKGAVCRFLLFLCAIFCAIFIPIYVLQHISFIKSLYEISNIRMVLIGIWLGVIWLYIILNWEALKNRLLD